MAEKKTGTKTRARKAASAKGKESAGSDAKAAVPESVLRHDPLRDQLLPLDPAAPIVCMISGEVQEPAEDAEPWTDDQEMLVDAFAWAEARLMRIAAQIDVAERLGVTTDTDEAVRKWEGVAIRTQPIPESLVRAEAQAKVLHGEWKGKGRPAEGVGRRALAEDFIFPEQDYMEADCRRDEAQERLVKLSRLRLWLMRAVQREVRASRRLMERRHASRATGWTPLLDGLGDEAGLDLLERSVLLLLLGDLLDAGVRRGIAQLEERGLRKSWIEVTAEQVAVFAMLDMRGVLRLRRAISREGALVRRRLIMDARQYPEDDATASVRRGMTLHNDVLDRLSEACVPG